MKRASENKEFPYASKFVCYFEVFPDGTVAEISNDVRAVEPAFQRASEGTVKIYAVLPERYVSSLYEIDDINLLADAYGIARPDDHVHDISWKLSSIDDGRSSYASVETFFLCGCKVTFDNIRKIAADLQRQKGWIMATSTGISCNYKPGEPEKYILRIRRSSLK